MTPIETRRAARTARRLAVVAGLVFSLPATSLAQTDTARITYRTREIAFVNKGRADRLAVGDTLDILGDDGSPMAHAVVVSLAEHRASARLTDPGIPVRTGQLVRFLPRAEDLTAAAPLPPPDSGGIGLPAAEPRVEQEGGTNRGSSTRGPPSRLRGGLAIEQYASNAGNSGGLGTDATIAALDFDLPLGGAAQLLVRGNGRWLGGSSRTLTAAPSFRSLLYQGELRIQPGGGGWSASLGRFVPPGAIGLGYIDGGRLEIRIAPGQHLGLIGGFVPRIEDLQPSTQTQRAGLYWAFGGSGRMEGSLVAASDWGGGTRRRTEIAGQAFWRAVARTTVSAYWELDLPAGSVSGTQLTTLSASIQSPLPLGFRAGLSLEAHEPIQIWNAAIPPDTTVPLAGRLTGASLNLSHDIAGFYVDLSGGLLKRVGDAHPTTQGSLTASRGFLFLTALAQHGDLMDYQSAMMMFRLPGSLPFSVSLGAGASATRTANGGMTFVRYSLRPELSQYLGSGVLASLGGDIGRYAGRSSLWLHAGVSYRLR